METCGPLYQRMLDQFTGGDTRKVRAFAAGFIVGQAEKVYLGACKAAMFRPSEVHNPMIYSLACDVAQVYDLDVTAIHDEIWIARRGYYSTQRDIDSLRSMVVNSPEWHLTRGDLTGVPASEIDLEFHTRKGYGEPCDIVKGGSDGESR